MSKNSSIHCTVCECKNHACRENYCTLTSIQVGANNPHPHCPECTDCNSFVAKCECK